MKKELNLKLYPTGMDVALKVVTKDKTAAKTQRSVGLCRLPI